jgi:hypothetical protein
MLYRTGVKSKFWESEVAISHSCVRVIGSAVGRTGKSQEILVHPAEARAGVE